MDFNQIRYFLALADTLNFTRAAEHCYVSQPALTQAIKRLEAELGGELIRRDGRNTELTDLGKTLRGHFEQIDRTRHMVSTTAKAVTSGEIAELNIGLMCTIGPQMLARMLDKFQIQHPMVSIVFHDVTLASIPVMLMSGAIDAAFCARHDQAHPQLSYVGLFEEAMVIAFPPNHHFAQLEAIPLRAVANERYVDRLHCEFRDEFNDLFKRQNLGLDVAFSSQREDWIQSMVRDGVGVSIIPRYSLTQPGIDHRPIVDPVLSRSVEFAFVERAESAPALGMLIEHTKKHDWQLPSSS